jgi:hypothetical protein
VRADEVSFSGSITTDIINRIMHSDYVVIDVTYPNPNVFYEMGLRHACRPGTVIIRDKNGPAVPFDISHLRHIEYENTPTGLKKLSESIRQFFDTIDANAKHPDNHFLEIARLTKYKFMDYSEEKLEPEAELIMSVLKSPELLDLMLRHQKDEPMDQAEVIQVLAKNPQVAGPLINSMVRTGKLDLTSAPHKPVARAKKRRKK